MWHLRGQLFYGWFRKATRDNTQFEGCHVIWEYAWVSGGDEECILIFMVYDVRFITIMV